MIHRTFTIRMILYIALVVVGGVLLYTNFQLGIVRYFDSDELTHIHWSHNLFAGVKPYTGFLYFIPPVFLLALAPLFWISGISIKIFLYARILEFGFFALFLLFLFLFVRKARNTFVALLTLVILLFLPIPGDKFLEVRPDTLSVGCILAGMYFLLKALEQKKIYFFLTGFFYLLGIAVSPKTLFFLPACILVLLWLHVRGVLRCIDRRWIIAGGSIPVVLVLGVFFWSGDAAKALYLTIGFANTASKVLGAKFFMLPNLFFYPNDVYYALGGYSSVYILNLILYITACLWALIRTVSCYNYDNWKRRAIEMLIAFSFFANLYGFVNVFPLKHVQYLIAIAPFIAFYFADLVWAIGNKIHTGPVPSSPPAGGSSGQALHDDVGLPFVASLLRARGALARATLTVRIFSRVYQLAIVIFVIYMGWLGIKIYQIKRNWNNSTTYAELFSVIQKVPKDEYVLDLIGTSTFYKDPYYVCCLPYGQYEEAFAFQLPSLAQALKNTQTKYIFVQHAPRVNVLPPPDTKFISEHYVPDPYVYSLLVAGAKLVFANQNQEQKVALVADGYYQILSNNQLLPVSTSTQLVTVDGTIIKENPVYLKAGEHKIRSGKEGELVLIYSHKKV